MDRATLETMFEGAFLSEVTDFVERQVSHAIPVPSARAVLNVLVDYLIAGGRLHVLAEGSHDGQVWSTTGLTSLACLSIASGATVVSSSAVTVTYGFLRLRAYVTGGIPTKSIFSARLVFSNP